MSVIASVSALSILSIYLSDDKCQEIPEEFSGNNYREIFLVEIMAKIPDDITLTLCNTKFPEKIPAISYGGNFTEEFLTGQEWVTFPDINL